jgi:hypothetical protein
MESKCPCCGSELEFGDKIPGFYPTVDCRKCGFPRNPKVRTHIAAAMDLARATTAYFSDGGEAAKPLLQEAGQRVLEVFGGE